MAQRLQPTGIPETVRHGDTGTHIVTQFGAHLADGFVMVRKAPPPAPEPPVPAPPPPPAPVPVVSYAWVRDAWGTVEPMLKDGVWRRRASEPLERWNGAPTYSFDWLP